MQFMWEEAYARCEDTEAEHGLNIVRPKISANVQHSTDYDRLFNNIPSQIIATSKCSSDPVPEDVFKITCDENVYIEIPNNLPRK